MGEVFPDPLYGAQPVTGERKHALLEQRLQAQGIDFPRTAVQKMARYQEMLEDWNGRMNLTGDASFEALLDAHLMDSLAPLSVAGLLPENAAVIDVGSGAGLPGVPLAIVRPDLQITLLDSQLKRVTFLEAVTEALELQNTSVLHARAEDAARDARYRERFAVATARAVAALPALLELLLPFVRGGGCCICFKGPSADAEMEAGALAAQLLGGGMPEARAVSLPFLPDARHTLVVTEKIRPTPGRFPRRAGTPAKKPLGIG